MTAIGVIGNCQSRGLSIALRRMLPGADVRLFSLDQPNSREQADAFAAQAKYFDVVFAQSVGHTGFATEMPEFFQTDRGVNVAWPVVTFHGFQPDCAYLTSAGAEIMGAVGPYNSLIVAACFSIGVDRARVSSMFNRFVLKATGLLSRFPAELAAFETFMRQKGYDPDPIVGLAGSFMHTINHPRLAALAELAFQAALKAGFEPVRLPEDTWAADDPLAKSYRWPVYPPLAADLSVTGSMNYYHDTRLIQLDEIIERAYATYSALPSGIDPIPELDEAISALRKVVR